MWLARYFPGLSLRPDDIGQMTPEETRAMFKAGRRLLKIEAEERLMHTRVIAASAGARMR